MSKCGSVVFIVVKYFILLISDKCDFHLPVWLFICTVIIKTNTSYIHTKKGKSRFNYDFFGTINIFTDHGIVIHMYTYIDRNWITPENNDAVA